MGATEFQTRVAASLGLDVTGDSEGVAAARILDDVAEAVGERHGRLPATEKQVAFARELGLDASDDSKRVASARIDDELCRRNIVALASLKLKPGDRVLKRTVVIVGGERREWTREYEVSSIRPNTRVFFKGGNGQGAWPTQLEKLGGGSGS